MCRIRTSIYRKQCFVCRIEPRNPSHILRLSNYIARNYNIYYEVLSYTKRCTLPAPNLLRTNRDECCPVVYTNRGRTIDHAARSIVVRSATGLGWSWAAGSPRATASDAPRALHFACNPEVGEGVSEGLYAEQGGRRQAATRVRLRRLPTRTQRMWGTETRLSPKYGGHQRRHPPAQAKRERCAECCARGEPAAPLVQIRRVAE